MLLLLNFSLTRPPPFKCSALALLFYGLEYRTMWLAGRPRDADAMRELARGLRMQLRREDTDHGDDDGDGAEAWRLSSGWLKLTSK